MSSSKNRQRYLALIREFSARVVLFHDAIAEAAGLHVTDVKVLHLLGDEALTAGQLVEQTALTGAAITAVVDRLEKAGYVRRERGEADRRRVTVRAVPAKLKTLDRLYQDYGADMAALLSHYTDAEFAVIERYLSQTTALLAAHAAKLRQARKT
jgi:DNA-binding MarR family transcriptional regulator